MKKLLVKFTKWVAPELTMTRKESLEAIKNLQSKLNGSRKDSIHWRKKWAEGKVAVRRVKRLAEVYDFNDKVLDFKNDTDNY